MEYRARIFDGPRLVDDFVFEARTDAAAVEYVKRDSGYQSAEGENCWVELIEVRGVPFWGDGNE